MPLMEENVSITQLERTKSTHPYFENAVGLHNRRPSRNHTTTGKEASSFVPSPSNDQDQDEQIEMFFEEDEIHAADQNQEGDKRKREIAQPSDCDVVRC